MGLGVMEEKSQLGEMFECVANHEKSKVDGFDGLCVILRSSLIDCIEERSHAIELWRRRTSIKKKKKKKKKII